MQLNTFKRSVIALVIAGTTTSAQAALYTIETINGGTTGESSKATAITANGEKVALEVLKGPVGIDYSQELSFMMDVRNQINSLYDLQDYCYYYLGYETCATWANSKWYGLMASGEVCESLDSPQLCLGGFKKSIDAWSKNTPYTRNSSAFIDGTPVNPFGNGVTGTAPLGTVQANSADVLINGFSSTGFAVGSSSSPYYLAADNNARAFMRRGFNDQQELQPPLSSTVLIASIGQTNAKGIIAIPGGELIFGSASVANMADFGSGNKVPEGTDLSSLASCSSVPNYADRACQYIQFANQAAVWLTAYTNNNALARVIDDFPNGATGNGDQTAQASIHAAATLPGATGPTLVGFTTFNNNGFFATAVKYSPILDFTQCLSDLETDATKRCWTREVIPGINIRQNDDITYSYTVANDINTRGVVIGVAKYAREASGSFAENIFVNEGASTTQLGLSQSPMFFYGYNATAASINNNNEIVGKIDVEQIRDRARRQRGYIYLHGAALNLASFNNQRAWLLDDLTNDGNPTGIANQYRISEAFDISDNGNIAASAFYCAGGYRSTVQNSLCNGVEELVAVKLTRQAGTILPRLDEKDPIKRSGGGIGLFALSFIVICGIFRRKQLLPFLAHLHKFERN